MSFLTIAGVTYEVVADGAKENEPEVAGEIMRTFNNGLRSTQRDRKRSWDFTLNEMSKADVDTLRGNVEDGAFVTVTGDFIGVESITAVVQVKNIPYLHRGTGFTQEVDIHIMEV